MCIYIYASIYIFVFISIHTPQDNKKLFNGKKELPEHMFGIGF